MPRYSTIREVRIATLTIPFLVTIIPGSKTSSKRFTPSLDLYLRKDFNSKSSLELEVLGTLSSTDYRHTMTENLSDGRDETYITDTDSKRRSLISEISYVHSFSDLTELSAGYQNTVSGNDNRYLATRL